jgi:hypothetical protein
MENTAQTENQTTQPTPPSVASTPVAENPINSQPPINPNAADNKPRLFMPRKTLILIIVLSIATVGLLILALIPNLKTPVKTTPKSTAIIHDAQTDLSFSAPIISSSSALQSNVEIATGRNKVTAVQLELTFNPKALTNVEIAPGTFFTNPVIILKKIDTENGRITYALGVGLGQKAVTGRGTLAVLTFIPVAGKTEPTSINFLPKTEVAAQGQIMSVLRKSSGAIINLISPTPTP